MARGLKGFLSSFFHPARRLLFDHLPKCAGTTVGGYLHSQYPAPAIFQIDGSQPQASVRQFREMSAAKRFRYRLICGHLAHQLLDVVTPDTLALTILREPVDRIISHYYYVRRQPTHYLHRRVMDDDIALEDYASHELSLELSNWYTAHYSGWTIEQVNESPQAALNLAYDTVTERYDIIGFQDALPEAMAAVGLAAGLATSFENAYLNKTAKRDRLSDVSEVARTRIADANSLDIELYERLNALRPRSARLRHTTKSDWSMSALSMS
ncbi:MAG TPA: sulfotransferase family 2 domain-containing protein [Caulifigura sp.]|jgi:hypothetical protein|nr:sulfotransferase family 2 domain-containing protein [Caulifigura sp.]